MSDQFNSTRNLSGLTCSVVFWSTHPVAIAQFTNLVTLALSLEFPWTQLSLTVLHECHAHRLRSLVIEWFGSDPLLTSTWPCSIDDDASSDSAFDPDTFKELRDIRFEFWFKLPESDTGPLSESYQRILAQLEERIPKLYKHGVQVTINVIPTPIREATNSTEVCTNIDIRRSRSYV